MSFEAKIVILQVLIVFIVFHSSLSCTGLELVTAYHSYCYALTWILDLIVSANKRI